MKRIGGKGEGKWQRISPEEALGTIALKIRWAKEEYGRESIAFIHCDGSRGNFDPACALTNAPGNRMIYGTNAHYYFRPHGVACMVTFGRGNFFAEHDGFDPANSKCIFTWGASHFESQLSQGKNIIKAMKNRAKLIVVDPKFTNITAKADLWLQVRPATDGASALGMLNYIIEKELCDKEFVNKFYFGFDQLKQRDKEYPLRKVSEITRVPEEDILQAATMYATLKPASLALYMDLSVNTNTIQAMRTVHLLIALTGNVDVKGGNLIFGYTHLPVMGSTHPKIYPGLPEDEMVKASTVKDRPIYYGKNALLFAYSHF